MLIKLKDDGIKDIKDDLVDYIEFGGTFSPEEKVFVRRYFGYNDNKYRGR